MVSLVKKTIRGHPYYYARECQRINGKPKIVRTVYLGSADDLIAAATKQRQGQIPTPQSVDIAAFADGHIKGYSVVAEVFANMTESKRLIDAAWDKIFTLGQEPVEIMKEVSRKVEEAQERVT